MIKLIGNNTRGLTRRRLLRGAVTGASAAVGLMGSRVWANGAHEPHEGPLFVTLQLDGGVDVTQLCDPKINVPGEPKINHWADQSDPGQTGNFLYAPVASNAQFFERFAGDMMVINGVDSQTNSHETGRLYNWTGSNAEGRPSLSALFAAAQSPQQPLAYSVFGGFSRTAGVIGYNRFDDLSNMGALVQPNVDPWSGDPKRPDADVARSNAMVRERVHALLSQPKLSVRRRASASRFVEAREGRESLRRLAELVPAEEDIMRREDLSAGGMTFSSSLKQQIQGALLIFKAGLGSAADMSLGGFDSHDQHDSVSDTLLSHFYDAVSYFWDSAEEMGLADRILLVIGSDFSRTNFYNDADGKDHWPIGSYIVMEQGASWGDRVVGLTDELHFAKPINAKTLQEDAKGLVMTPAYVHKALREYLGLDTFAADLGLDFTEETLPLFNPFLSS